MGELSKHQIGQLQAMLRGFASRPDSRTVHVEFTPTTTGWTITAYLDPKEQA